MRPTRHHWRLGVALAGAVAIAACSSACPRTEVELIAHGGFAYIDGPNRSVNIAFMKSVDNQQEQCKVDQLGVDLKVDDGKIIEPTGTSTTFDPGGAVVTIEGADTSGVTVIGPGIPGPPFHPNNPANEDDWKDVKWVPNTRPRFQQNPVNPNWRSMVDGRVELTQGLLRGGKPSDGAAVIGTWTFKKPGDTTGTSSFQQSISDRTHYLVTLRRRQVVINLTGARGPVKRIVVEPVDARRKVGLMLIGRHPPQTPAVVKVGDPITHFCAFYELLSTPVPRNDRYIPHFDGVPGSTAQAGSGATIGGPSPGAYCPGDWP